PTIAKTMVARLYGEVALVPATVELSAQQLTQLAQFPRHPSWPLSDADAQKLQALAAVSPVAGLSYLTHLYQLQVLDAGIRPQNNMSAAALQLARQAGQNTLALSMAGMRTANLAALTSYWQPLAAR